METELRSYTGNIFSLSLSQSAVTKTPILLFFYNSHNLCLQWKVCCNKKKRLRIKFYSDNNVVLWNILLKTFHLLVQLTPPNNICSTICSLNSLNIVWPHCISTRPCSGRCSALLKCKGSPLAIVKFLIWHWLKNNWIFWAEYSAQMDVHLQVVPFLFWPFWIWPTVSIINFMFIFYNIFTRIIISQVASVWIWYIFKEVMVQTTTSFISHKYHLLYPYLLFIINASGKQHVSALQVAIKIFPAEPRHWPGLSSILSQLSGI